MFELLRQQLPDTGNLVAGQFCQYVIDRCANAIARCVIKLGRQTADTLRQMTTHIGVRIARQDKSGLYRCRVVPGNRPANIDIGIIGKKIENFGLNVAAPGQRTARLWRLVGRHTFRLFIIGRR